MIITNNKITIDANCLKFFVNPPENTKTAIYREAVERAYGDMSRHTLHFDEDFKSLSNKDKEGVRQTIQNNITLELEKDEITLFKIKSLNEYDKWHRNKCEKITSIFTDTKYIKATSANENDKKIRKNTFSGGQAQKVLNMAIKYVFLFYVYFNAVDGGFKTELDSFYKIIDFLHTPIDSYVIDAACNKPTEKKDNVFYLGCSKPIFPWSQLSYDEYLDFQNDIRLKLGEEGNVPFIWELKNYPFK